MVTESGRQSYRAVLAALEALPAGVSAAVILAHAFATAGCDDSKPVCAEPSAQCGESQVPPETSTGAPGADGSVPGDSAPVDGSTLVEGAEGQASDASAGSGDAAADAGRPADAGESASAGDAGTAAPAPPDAATDEPGEYGETCAVDADCVSTFMCCVHFGNKIGECLPFEVCFP